MNTPEPSPAVADLPEVPAVFGGTWPIRVRNFIARHLETLFVILIAGMVVAVFNFFPYKIAFLNFFYLPVLTAAYFMGKRKAVLGGTLCILLVGFFAIQHPDWFSVEGTRLN